MVIVSSVRGDKSRKGSLALGHAGAFLEGEMQFSKWVSSMSRSVATKRPRMTI